MARASLESQIAFIACVDCGGFSKAAKKLKKSQGTISILIANLEDDLGISLFERTGRSPKLTEQGKIIYNHTRNVVLAQQALFDVAGKLLNTKEVAISLLISDYIPDYQRELVKEQFMERVTGIRLTLLTAESYDVESMLLNGEATLAVIPSMKSRMNYPFELMAQRTWFKAPMKIYCSESHPLSQIDNVTEKDIQGLRRIRLVRGTTTNNSPRDDILTDNLFRAYRLCAQAFGWCELPEWVVDTQRKLGDNRLIELNVAPSKNVLDFDILYKKEPKGCFSNWFIQKVTESCHKGN